MIVGNMSDAEIAFALDVEPSVVDKVVKDLFSKLGATDIKAATAIATKLNLINLEP